MNSTTKPKRYSWLAAFIVIGGLAISYGALVGPSVGQNVYWAASPFGWRRVIVVHLLAAVPLTWLVAGHSSQQFGVLSNRLSLPLTLAFGTILAWGSMQFASPLIAAAMHQSDFATRHVVRFCWSVVLLGPWCLASQMVLVSRSAERQEKSTWLVDTAMALLVAIALPGVFVHRIIGQETRNAGQLVATDRLPEAYRAVYGLYSLGSARPIEFPIPEFEPQLPLELLTNLDSGLQQAGQKVLQLSASLEPAGSALTLEQTSAIRLELATTLRMLERGAEGLAALGELATERPDGALLAARIESDLNDWPAAIKSCQRALALLSEQGGKPADQTAKQQRDSYHTLAVALRSARRYDESADVLREAIERLPDSRAEFHLELGRHYEMGGRAFAANAELKRAIAIDPKLSDKAEAILQKMQANSPVCLIPTGWRTD